MSAVKQPAQRRALPFDDSTDWSFQDRGNEWRWYVSSDSNEVIWIESHCFIDHARGRREIGMLGELTKLLDSLAATKVGRKALLDALVRHES